MKWSTRLMSLVVIALSVALIADSALAQPGGRGRGGGPGGFRPGMMGGPGGAMGLLRAEVVRTELGIGEATVEELQEIRRETMSRGERPDFGALRDLSEEERRARFEEMRERMREQMRERMEEMEKKVAEVIGKEKFGRLKEIELQMAGVQAVMRPEVVDYLGIGEEQQQEIRDLMAASWEKARGKMEEIVPGGFRGMRDMSEEERQAAGEKMRAARDALEQELQKNIMGVLTDEQKKKLGDMMGEPFAKMEELQEQLRAGFGRGRGGPEGRRGDRRDRGRRGGGERRSRGPA